MELNIKERKELLKKVENLISSSVADNWLYLELADKIIKEIELIPTATDKNESCCGDTCKCNK